jgi:flavin reductase (DIM6/NTAB) family NADH-FMN oxidoreductase RutF
MKKEVPISKAKWLVEPGCVLLVTSGQPDNANIMTFSWQTPIHSGEPCLVLLVINPERYSYELIMKNKQLVINVPGQELVEKVHRVGTVSGRKVDKFKMTGLTAMPAKKVAAPLIDECAAHLECEVVRNIDLEYHYLLICQAIRAVVEKDYFDGSWNPELFHTLHYLGGRKYGSLEKMVAI